MRQICGSVQHEAYTNYSPLCSTWRREERSRSGKAKSVKPCSEVIRRGSLGSKLLLKDFRGNPASDTIGRKGLVQTCSAPRASHNPFEHWTGSEGSGSALGAEGTSNIASKSTLSVQGDFSVRVGGPVKADIGSVGDER